VSYSSETPHHENTHKLQTHHLTRRLGCHGLQLCTQRSRDAGCHSGSLPPRECGRKDPPRKQEAQARLRITDDPISRPGSRELFPEPGGGRRCLLRGLHGILLCLKSGKLFEDLVRFHERLLASNIKPGSRNVPSSHVDLGVEPLDKASRLIGIVSFGDIGVDER